MRLTNVVFAFAFLALPLVSRPATASVVNYSVSGTFANGATFLPGSILTIDTTAGIVSNSDLLVSAGSRKYFYRREPQSEWRISDSLRLGSGGRNRPDDVQRCN